MTEHHIHSDYGYGDCFWLIAWLRRMAAKYPDHRFTLWTHHYRVREFEAFVSDLPNLAMGTGERPSGTIGASLNDQHIDIFRRLYPQSPLPNERISWGHINPSVDQVNTILVLTYVLSGKLGLENACLERKDLLLNSPTIQSESTCFPADFDFLVVNSKPCSGCFRFSEEESRHLIDRLCERYKVIRTNFYEEPHRWIYTMGQIGGLSLRCKYIIGTLSGPFWPTANIFNTHVPRWCLHDKSVLDYGIQGWRHLHSFADCEADLEILGLL